MTGMMPEISNPNIKMGAIISAASFCITTTSYYHQSYISLGSVMYPVMALAPAVAGEQR